MFRASEVRCTVAFVEPGIFATKELSHERFPVLFRTGCRMLVFPVLAESLEIVEFVLRQRVAEAESYEVRGPILPPMRKVAVIDSDGLVGIEASKGWRRGEMECLDGHERAAP
jgi:hypothetical protein